jgi:hypothetical protein
MNDPRRFRRGALAALALLLALGPRPASGQINADSLQAFLDNDRNCSDFTGWMDATVHLRALQVIVGDPDADPHGLDADGNGYACESKDALRRLATSDTSDFYVETVEVISEAQCEPMQERFDVQALADELRSAPFEQWDYLPMMDKAECLDTIHEIIQEAGL